MAFHTFYARLAVPSRTLADRRLSKTITRLGAGLFATGLSFGLAMPALSADPFRTTSEYNIGEHTEAAFEAIFKEGDYVAAEAALAEAEISEADDPLVHAMLASLAYLEARRDSSRWDEVANRATLTKQSAEALKETEPLRGHLYSAVGTFLEGAHMLKTQGVARGTPRALAMLQTVFSELDKAEAIDATDPELNLLKGYMDLMLAVNLPFSDPEDAIARMSQYGSPTYLTQRGLAIGYRDLDQIENAMNAVNEAIAAAPDNPELKYLKAQLLVRQDKQAESIPLFEEALQYKDQLPDALVQRITWEGCIAGGTDPEECSRQVGYN